MIKNENMKNLKIEKQKINESFQHSEKYAHGEVRSFKEFKELRNNLPDYFLVDLKNKKIVAGYAAYNVPNYGIYTGNKNKSGYEIWNRSTMKNPDPYLNQFPLDYEDKNNWLVVDPKIEENLKNSDEEIYTQHESKMSLEDYSKRVKKLVDKATFDDQDFYDHMIDCFIEGKTPEACAKFNESESESTFDTFDELPSIEDPFRIMVTKHNSDKIDDILKNLPGIYRDDYEFYGDIYGDFDYEVGFSDKRKRDKAVKLLQKAEKNGSLNESESTWSKLKAITEANRIQVKRKYTEIHPAKYVGKRARVRNEIIKYLGSNQLMTEDEFEDLLSKNAKHPLLWKKRNCDVYEQGEDGYIRLSKKGSRIFGGLNSVNEADSNLEVDLIDVWTIKDKSKLNAVLKYLQTNDVEFEYNPKSLSVEIIDVSNLTPKGLEELQKMLK